MRKIALVPFAFSAALGAAVGCTSPAPAATTASGPSAVAPAASAWVDKIKAGAVVIDVRSQDEWNGGHLEQAKLIPVNEMQSRLAEIEALVGGDKSKPVVLYCRSGNRAGTARAMLVQAGFTNVDNAGGLDDVKAALSRQGS